MELGPPSSIPPLALHPDVKAEEVDAQAIAKDWLSKFAKVFAERDFQLLPGLFVDDSWFKDVISLGWDITAKHGIEAIQKYFSTAETGLNDLELVSGGLQPVLLDMGVIAWLQFGFSYTNAHGRGRGFVRLANIDASTWKAWLVYTQLEELNSEHQETSKPVINETTTTKANNEFQVVIVGAGQAALALAAHLQKQGNKTLMLDKNPRIGDSWRNRYKTVALHTPKFTDHYPFLAYPDDWPKYLPRDKVADFMEYYAKAMNLNIQLNAEATNVEYDESTRKYHIIVQGPEGAQTLSCHHVVLATGIFADEPIIPKFPGQETFQGRLYHSCKHGSANDIPQLHDKKVVIVGAGSSGHDIALDFANCGAKEVSMIQRQSIFSFSYDSVEKFQLTPWSTEGVNMEEADIITNSFPTAVARGMSPGMTMAMYENDKEMIQGLQNSGLAVKTGMDGYGFSEHQLVKGGSFYLDQGANQHIVSGRIKVFHCEKGIQELNATGITLADGRSIEADVIVLATGFKKCHLNVKRLMGEEVWRKCGAESFGELDQEQERAGIWRPTGVPGFWYMTGSFIWSRQYSPALALQINAAEKGINKAYRFPQEQ